MKILITGASGLVGQALQQAFSSHHEIMRAVRRSSDQGPDAISWNPPDAGLDFPKGAALDGVVHLSGESIAGGRWTDARKQRLWSSRVDVTRFLIDRLRDQPRKPKVLVAASAVGVYGSRGDEILTESAGPGDGFLADLGRAWEAEISRAEELGIRVVILRFGTIISPDGGFLARLLPIYKLGLGGVLGKRQAYLSWISLHDLVQIIGRALERESVSGIYNAVAPDPVTQREFTETLGRLLRRPTLAHVPPFVVRTIFGEMGEELLMGSSRAVPSRLEAEGIRFAHADLESALAWAIDRSRR